MEGLPCTWGWGGTSWAMRISNPPEASSAPNAFLNSGSSLETLPRTLARPSRRGPWDASTAPRPFPSRHAHRNREWKRHWSRAKEGGGGVERRRWNRPRGWHVILMIVALWPFMVVDFSRRQGRRLSASTYLPVRRFICSSWIPCSRMGML